MVETMFSFSMNKRSGVAPLAEASMPLCLIDSSKNAVKYFGNHAQQTYGMLQGRPHKWVRSDGRSLHARSRYRICDAGLCQGRRVGRCARHHGITTDFLHCAYALSPRGAWLA